MNKNIMYLIVGIIALMLILPSLQQRKEYKKEAGESSSRSFARANIYTNQDTTVSIQVVPGTSTHYILEERLPTGWTVTSASDGGDYTTTPGKIFWIILTASGTKTYTYTANPNNNVGSQVFTGIVKFELIATQNIGGASSVTVTSCTSSAETCDNIDNNCDYSIDESLSRACGSGNCVSTQTCTAGVWGSCGKSGTDCGICCKCALSSPWAEGYDSSQSADCTATTCVADGCNLGGCGLHIFSDYPASVANICSALKVCTSNACTPTCTADSDSDGWAGASSSYTSCYDCNNADATIYSTAIEVCGDNKNNDCVGGVETYFNRADWGSPNGFCTGTICCDNDISIEELSTAITQYKTAGFSIEDLSASITAYKT